jgi:hypothetical protein
MLSLLDSVENGFSMEFLARKGPVDTKGWCMQLVEMSLLQMPEESHQLCL